MPVPRQINIVDIISIIPSRPRYFSFHQAASLFKFFIWDININLELDFSVWENCMKLDKFFLWWKTLNSPSFLPLAPTGLRMKQKLYLLNLSYVKLVGPQGLTTSQGRGVVGFNSLLMWSVRMLEPINAQYVKWEDWKVWLH